MIPALSPIKDMTGELQTTMRLMLRNMVSFGIVKSELGLEATEEVLEIMYNIGKIKFSMEPVTDQGQGMRILMFDEKRNAYGVINHIILKNPPQEDFNGPGPLNVRIDAT